MDTQIINKWFVGPPSTIKPPRRPQGYYTITATFESTAKKHDFLLSSDWSLLTNGYSAHINSETEDTLTITLSGSCD